MRVINFVVLITYLINIFCGAFALGELNNNASSSDVEVYSSVSVSNDASDYTLLLDKKYNLTSAYGKNSLHLVGMYPEEIRK